MMRITLVFFGALSLSFSVDGWTLRPRWRSEESRPYEKTQWELRQRFLLDLMLQVHKPLLQQELIEMGRHLNENPDDYVTDSWPLLLDFMDDVHQNRVLRPYSIYSQVHEKLPHQLLGVYRLFVFSKDWKTFQQNVCYARIRFNAVLFVNALQLAIGERPDTKDLILPAIHEILPQLYFNKEVVLEAQKVSWQQLAPGPTISNKRSWRETLGNIIFPKMSSEAREKVLLLPSDPVVIEVKPLITQLSLDVELNEFWNRLISRLMIAHQCSADSDRLLPIHDELQGNPARSRDHLLLIYSIKQFVALLKLEELATGTKPLQLIEPPLVTTGGVPYRATGLNAEAVSLLISESIEELRRQIDNELRNANKMQPMWKVGKIIATQLWQMCRHLSQAINGNHAEPYLFGMATSNLRDPIYRLLIVQIYQLIVHYESRFKKPTHHNNLLQLRQIRVGKLETYDQLVDTDLINLMDQQLLQTQRNNLQLLRRRLVARQFRLNHKPFNITYELFAQAPIEVLFKSYLVPTGHHQPRLLLDAFVSQLETGVNYLERHYPTASNGYTLSDLYEAKHPLNAISPCSFPKHLLLPRGTAKGLKLQLLVEISLWHTTELLPECEWPATVEQLPGHNIITEILDVYVQHHEKGNALW